MTVIICDEHVLEPTYSKHTKGKQTSVDNLHKCRQFVCASTARVVDVLSKWMNHNHLSKIRFKQLSLHKDSRLEKTNTICVTVIRGEETSENTEKNIGYRICAYIETVTEMHWDEQTYTLKVATCDIQ